MSAECVAIAHTGYAQAPVRPGRAVHGDRLCTHPLINAQKSFSSFFRL